MSLILLRFGRRGLSQKDVEMNTFDPLIKIHVFLYTNVKRPEIYAKKWALVSH